MILLRVFLHFALSQPAGPNKDCRGDLHRAMALLKHAEPIELSCFKIVMNKLLYHARKGTLHEFAFEWVEVFVVSFGCFPIFTCLHHL